MSPATHFLVGWLVSNSASLNRRERAAVAIAGIAPDFDAFGAVPELLTRHSSHPLPWFSQYHHIFGHNLAFALVVTVTTFLIATRRWKTAALAFVSFHLHLLGDIVGARGPEGYQWPIPYLWPFSDAWQWTWSGQWALNGWQNFLITGVALIATFYLAWKKGYSPLEIISTRADAAFVATLRQRFPQEMPS